MEYLGKNDEFIEATKKISLEKEDKITKKQHDELKEILDKIGLDDVTESSINIRIINEILDKELLVRANEQKTKLPHETLYIAADYVKNYANMEYYLYSEPLHMQVYTRWDSFTGMEVSNKTQLRYKGGVKSEIFKDLAVGDKVTILEKMDSWSRVKTADASIGFVENGIADTKAVVPAEKIINAIPFYTRVWESGPEGLKASTLTMASQKQWVSKTGIEPVWLEQYCQNYVEYQSGDTLKKK